MTIKEIETEFKRLVADLPVHPEYKKFHISPTHTGSPHIEERSGFLHFVVTERGYELERKITNKPDELLFWLLESPAQLVATKQELKQRKEGIDGRRIWFPIMEELMEDMKPGWGIRLRDKHLQTLAAHPFRDEE